MWQHGGHQHRHVFYGLLVMSSITSCLITFGAIGFLWRSLQRSGWSQWLNQVEMSSESIQMFVKRWKIDGYHRYQDVGCPPPPLPLVSFAPIDKCCTKLIKFDISRFELRGGGGGEGGGGGGGGGGVRDNFTCKVEIFHVHVISSYVST